MAREALALGSCVFACKRAVCCTSMGLLLLLPEQPACQTAPQAPSHSPGGCVPALPPARLRRRQRQCCWSAAHSRRMHTLLQVLVLLLVGQVQSLLLPAV